MQSQLIKSWENSITYSAECLRRRSQSGMQLAGRALERLRSSHYAMSQQSLQVASSPLLFYDENLLHWGPLWGVLSNSSPLRRLSSLTPSLLLRYIRRTSKWLEGFPVPFARGSTYTRGGCSTSCRIRQVLSSCRASRWINADYWIVLLCQWYFCKMVTTRRQVAYLIKHATIMKLALGNNGTKKKYKDFTVSAIALK